MTPREPMLPKYQADAADAIIDQLLDLIDKEPEDVRARLLAVIKAGNHRAYRQPDGHTIVTFDGIPEVAYEITRARFDA